MSSSSLWVMDKEFIGQEVDEFHNSFLFSPVVWNVLFEKHLPEEAKNPFGKRSYLSATMLNNKIHYLLNEKINNSDIQEDRILWEISMQQVFFSKDKSIVANAIRAFHAINSDLTKDQGSHIQERFIEVADSIDKLNEQEHPYFIFKNTSVDDNVNSWFINDDEPSYRSLKDNHKIVTEFVIIEKEAIHKFITNVDYFKLGH